jgi:SAM-dependent methyltransferase/uncharacterized protein YbaR (Trm112 family)
MIALDLSDCRCVHCGKDDILVTQWSGDVNDKGLIECSSCGSSYEILDGIPYLMELEQADFLSLVEIAGEFDSSNYQPDKARPLDSAWPDLLKRRHETADGDLSALYEEIGPEMRPQLEDRYEQWREIWLLSREIDFKDKKVLVVGAGLGFDTNLLLHRGAIATAVDLNPQTNSFGRVQVPRARWIGAVGRRLPFVDGAFDYVAVSASLHHVLDVSATILEMLRVLKPGGSLITTNDSFSRDETTELEDAKSWNDHPAVLRGINENTPRLCVFIDPLIALQRNLEIEFWTSRAFGVWVDSQKTTMDFLMPRKWSLGHDHQRLRNAAGGLFMRVTPKVAMAREFTTPGQMIVKPSTLRSLIGNKRQAMAEIAHVAPKSFLSPKFPAAPGNTKFQVLNGWRWREEGELGREAYLLGRWWRLRSDREKVLYLRVAASLYPDASDPLFNVVVDGRVLASRRVHRGERTDIAVDVSDIRSDVPIAIEISMDPDSELFLHGLFRVERLDFVEEAKSGTEVKKHAVPDIETINAMCTEIPGHVTHESAEIWREIFEQQVEWGQFGSAVDIQPSRGRSTGLLLELCDKEETIFSLDYDDIRDSAVVQRGGERLKFVRAGGEELGAALDALPVRPRSVRFIHADPRPMFTVARDIILHSAALIGVDGVLALNNCQNNLLPQVWSGALYATFSQQADLRPFLIAHNFAYFCHARAHGRYLRFVRIKLFDRIIKKSRLMLSRTDASPLFDVFCIAPRVDEHPLYGESTYREYLKI